MGSQWDWWGSNGVPMGSMGSQRHQWGPRRPPAAVVVGADRIAANGDTANKIGTYSLAVAALHHGVPFYVAAPSSSWDPNVPNGASIPIEERPERELTELQGVRVAPHGEEPTWGWGAAGEGVIGQGTLMGGGVWGGGAL